LEQNILMFLWQPELTSGFTAREALLLIRKEMAFCINCGARNPTDAVFCQSCGQTLYHLPTGAVLGKRVSWQRNRTILSVVLFLVLATIIAIVSVTKPDEPSRKPANTLEKQRQKPSPIGEAVLTLVNFDRSGAAVSQGSGFILTSNGLAGSNYHVIKEAFQAVAKCCNGRIFDVQTIEGADLGKDLVVFRLKERGSAIEPQGLPFVTLGSSNDLTVGEKVFAVGSPQGLENTLSDGILSAVREYDSVRYLQITAPISPGSSGGPILNAKGELIGVASLQFEKGQNLNFAVAAEHLRPLLEQHFQVSLMEFQSLVRRAQNKRNAPAQTERVESPLVNPEPAVEPSTGRFGGIVHNLSAGLSAEFWIIVRDDEGILSGCMGVKQPLFGSGPLDGVTSGSDVTFFVTSEIGTISFQGRRQRGSITGSYTVTRDGSTDEEGTFTLRKLNSIGPRSDFDKAKCPTDTEIHR